MQTFIEEFIERQPKSRNAQLARLDMVHWRVQSGAQTADDLLSACQLYFDRSSNRLYCFEDLQKYLVALGKDLVSKFLDHVSSHVDEQSSGKDVCSCFPSFLC